MKFGAIYPHQEIGTDPVVIRDRYPRAASASDGIGCQTGCPDRFAVWGSNAPRRMRTQPGFFMRNCSLRVCTGIILKDPVVLHGSSGNDI